MKFKQIATISAPSPLVVALSEEGEIYMYTPATYVTHSGGGVREKVILDHGGWDKLPSPD